MTKSKKFNFAENFEQLSKIVEDLESGKSDLDKSLQDYEEGLKIVQACKSHLEKVENKVKVIREKYEESDQ